MIVSDEHQCVYIAIPRTASKSVARWMGYYYAGYVCGKHHSTDVPDWCKGYLVWTVGRDPYERAVSGYFAAHNDSSAPPPASGREFEQYIISGVLRPQVEPMDAAGVVQAIPFEHLPESLALLPFVTLPMPDLPFVGERGSRPAGGFFDLFGETEELIWRTYEPDFERLGYARGP